MQYPIGTAQAKGKLGGQLKFSALAIETASWVRLVYDLPWRHTKGFLLSLADKLELLRGMPKTARKG